MIELCIIEKRGLYYRPQACGYTGLKSAAGRFTFAEAAERAGPNGPDGPNDGIEIWCEKDAPDFAPACCPLEKQAHVRAWAQNSLVHLHRMKTSSGVRYGPWLEDLIKLCRAIAQ